MKKTASTVYKKRKSSAVRSGGPVVANGLDAMRERETRAKSGADNDASDDVLRGRAESLAA